MDTIVKHLILPALIFLLPLDSPADTYRWVDDEGIVTYSQTPPPGIEAKRIKSQTSTSGQTPSSREKLNQMRQYLTDRDEDRQILERKRQEEKKEKELKKRNCQAARSNLDKLQGLGNRLYQIDGEYRRLTEEERQGLMQKETEHMKKNCGN